MELITKAEEVKPRFGKKCNSCGWCCMTETCPVAKDLGAGEMIPCKFLKTANENGEYLCGLVDDDEYKLLLLALGIGTGCDAITQNERFEDLKNETVIHL